MMMVYHLTISYISYPEFVLHLGRVGSTQGLSPEFFLNKSFSLRFVPIVTLPETNSSPLKIDGWKMNFLLGPGIFSGTKMLVSGRVDEKFHEQNR